MIGQRIPFLVALVLTVALAAAAGTPAAAADSPELDSARREREQLGVEFDKVTAELETLTVAVTDAQTKRERLEPEVEALTRTASSARRLLTAQAVHAYKYGSFGPVGDMLTAVAPREVLERGRLIAGLTLQERQMVERAVLSRASLSSRRVELDRVLIDLRTSEARVAVLRKQLNAAFERAKEDERAIATLGDRARMVSRPGQKGVYACPMAQPYHFRNTWGAPRSGGRAHKGVDMFAPYGGNVYAITKGAVLRQANSGLGGLGFYLRGDDGNVYYYTHLASIQPGYRPGRRVVAGELIARNGDSGNARGGAPHVHMEVRPGGGGNVNPYPFAAAACF